MSEDKIVITSKEYCPIAYLEHNAGKMNNENVIIYKFKKSQMNEEQLKHMKWEVYFSFLNFLYLERDIISHQL